MAKLTEVPHPVSDRIMTMRIPLTKDRNATIVSAYAPTMANPQENKKEFYSQLNGTLILQRCLQYTIEIHTRSKV